MALRIISIAVFVCLCCCAAVPGLCAQEIVSLPVIVPTSSSHLSADSTSHVPRSPEPHASEMTPAATSPIQVPRHTEPVKGVVQRPFRAWLTLSLMGQAAVLADVKTTLDLRRAHPLTFRESDPLARPFVNLPPPTYTAAAIGFTAGLSLISWKLTHSENIWLRTHWWLPQTAQIVVNAECAAFNARK